MEQAGVEKDIGVTFDSGLTFEKHFRKGSLS